MFEDYSTYEGDVEEMTPPKRTYLVSAQIQLLVEESDSIYAMIAVKDLLNTLIEESTFRNDPLNGAVITTVVDVSEV